MLDRRDMLISLVMSALLGLSRNVDGAGKLAISSFGEDDSGARHILALIRGSERFLKLGQSYLEEYPQAGTPEEVLADIIGCEPPQKFSDLQEILRAKRQSDFATQILRLWVAGY